MRLRALACTFLAVAAPVAVRAQPFDHLACYKVGGDRHVRGTVDLTPAVAVLPAAPGCKIQGPVLYCAPAAKTNVHISPPPGGAPSGPAAVPYVCYKARCKGGGGTVGASDQFATFTLRARKAALLCAPAGAGSATTSTTTTTLVPPCAGAVYPFCGGACPDGFACQAVTEGNVLASANAVSYCTCVPAQLPCPAAAQGCAGGLGVCPTGQVCASAVTAIGGICGCAPAQ